MATSYKLFGDGNYIDSKGIAHNRVPLNEVLDNLNITAYYKKYENIYTTTTNNESTIPVGIDALNEATILFVDVNGLDKIENIDYTVNYSNKTITLTDALDVIGTKIHFVVLKTVAATDPSTYDLLKGEGIIPGGEKGQVLLKNSNNDFDTSWGDVSSVTVKRWEAED